MTTPTQKILVFGASGHAKVVIDLLEQTAAADIAGIIDSTLEAGSLFEGYPVLGDDDTVPQALDSTGADSFIIAIGDNTIRAKVVERIAAAFPELAQPAVSHPAASIAKNVTLGDGTVVMAGAVINTATKIGKGCIINSRASIDHDSTIGDFVSVGPGAVTGGNCAINDFAALGIGAKLNQGISIGEHSVIGSGATVVSDIGAYKVAMGTPAKETRDRVAGEKYL